MHETDICDYRNDSQGLFAIVAIDTFAKTANTSFMNDLHREQRRWLSEQLESAGRGSRSALAKHLKVRPDAISRMTNERGETREMSMPELVGMAEFFKVEPPGLGAARKAAARTDRPAVKWVPVIDYVQAGKLVAPSSQIQVEDVPLLAFADLGAGEWFGLRVQGSSMDRISPEDSVVIFNKRDRNLIVGRAYIFAIDGEVTYKRWHADPPYLEPFSTDPTHQPRFFKKKDIEVIGRVKRSILDL